MKVIWNDLAWYIKVPLVVGWIELFVFLLYVIANMASGLTV